MNPEAIISARDALFEVAERLRQQSTAVNVLTINNIILFIRLYFKNSYYCIIYNRYILIFRVYWQKQ
jgi:hypothetical protein